MEQAQSAFGVVAFVALAWAMGGARRGADWRFVGAALALAFALAAVTLIAPGATAALDAVSQLARALKAASETASAFVFGHVGGGPKPYDVIDPGASVSLAFQILPIVIVTAALAGLLGHLGVLDRVIRAVAWALEKTLGVSGPVGFAAGASLFLGIAETPLFLRERFARMSRSDLFATLTLCLATVAGTVFALYAVVLEPVQPDALAHILAASVISLPTALAVARLMEPPEAAADDAPASPDAAADAAEAAPMRRANSIDAIAQGALDGMKLFLNILAVLLVVIAFIALIDGALALLGPVAEGPLTVRRVFGWALAPAALLLGVPWAEAVDAGALLGAKMIANEFLAYLELAAAPPEALSPRTRLILIYAMCGFANLGSLGIALGVFATVAPGRRADVANLALKAWIAGNVTTAITGAMIGVLTAP